MMEDFVSEFPPILLDTALNNSSYASPVEGRLKRILQLMFAVTLVPDATDPTMSYLPISLPGVAVDDMVRDRSPVACLIVPMEEMRGRVIQRS